MQNRQARRSKRQGGKPVAKKSSSKPIVAPLVRSFVHRPLILLFSVAFALLLGAWQVMAAVAPQSLHRLVAAYTGTTADIATASDVANLHLAHVQPTTAGQLKAGQTVIMRDGRTMVVQSVSQSPASVPSAPALVTPSVASTPPSPSSSPSGGGDWILAPNNLPPTPPTGDVPPLPVAHSAQDLGFHPVKVQHMENVGDRVILTCFNPETKITETVTGKQGRDTVFTLKNADTDELPTSNIKDVEPGNLVATRDPQTGETAFGRVVRTIQRQTDALVALRLADSKTGQVVTSLTCTPEHPYYVQGQGWVEAGSLGVGSLIVTRAGPPLVVKGVDWQRAKAGTKPFTVYNFEVAGSHTYFVGKDNGGAWVHNACGMKFPNTPEEMDDMMGFKGERKPDIDMGTGQPLPGRSRVDWDMDTPNGRMRVTYEQHPYHTNAPEFHRGPHWHVDWPGRPAGPHPRFGSGDPFP